MRHATESNWILRKGSAQSGFQYRTESGRPVRSRGTLARIKSLGVPPAWRDVHISPKPGAAIQAWGHDARGRKQYRYHPRAMEQGASRKFHRIAGMGRDLPAIRARIARDLRGAGLTRRRVAAAVVRLIAEGYLRVGNERYEKENRSHGATTLRKSNVTVAGARVILHYRGKSAIEQRHTVVDRRLARFIGALHAAPGLHVFRYQNAGRWHDLTASDVNRYLRDLARVPYTAKDFRTWGGTLRAAVSLAATRPQPAASARDANRNVVAAIRAASEELGNTPAIARKSYVHPIVIAKYVDHGATIASYLTGECTRLARCTREEEALSEFLHSHFR
jgi:DNA topoisomerase I